MTWAVVLVLTVAYVVVMLRVAYWVGGLLAEAGMFLERACLCRKNAWHPDCAIHGRRRP